MWKSTVWFGCFVAIKLKILQTTQGCDLFHLWGNCCKRFCVFQKEKKRNSCCLTAVAYFFAFFALSCRKNVFFARISFASSSKACLFHCETSCFCDVSFNTLSVWMCVCGGGVFNGGSCPRTQSAVGHDAAASSDFSVLTEDYTQNCCSSPFSLGVSCAIRHRYGLLYLWVLILTFHYSNFFCFIFSPFLHLKKSFYIMQVGPNPSPEYAGAWDNQRGQLHLTVESQRLQALDRRNLLPGCSNSTTPAGFRCLKEHVANALPLLHHLAQPGYQAEKSAPVHQHWPGLKYTSITQAYQLLKMLLSFGWLAPTLLLSPDTLSRHTHTESLAAQQHFRFLRISL